MDGLSFAASVIRSVAWPAAVAVAVFLVRKPLKAWLKDPPRRLKVGPGGMEAEWDRSAGRAFGATVAARIAGATVEDEAPMLVVGETWDPLVDEMLVLAESASPMAAVEACYQQIGRTIGELIESVEPGGSKGLSVPRLAQRGFELGVVDRESLTAVSGLTTMHDLALIDERRDGLDVAKAREYAVLTSSTISALRNRPRR